MGMAAGGEGVNVLCSCCIASFASFSSRLATKKKNSLEGGTCLYQKKKKKGMNNIEKHENGADITAVRRCCVQATAAGAASGQTQRQDAPRGAITINFALFLAYNRTHFLNMQWR